MLDLILGKRFDSKCKSLLKITKCRLHGVKNKRNSVQRYLKNDVADLLRGGLYRNAYDRIEGLLIEVNITKCYEHVEEFCAVITAHISAMYKQSECPEQCKEAVSSLMYAAARFSDLPELRDLRNIFNRKYNNSLNSYTKQEFIEILKQKTVNEEMKLKWMEDIAMEFSVDLNMDVFLESKKNSRTQLKEGGGTGGGGCDEGGRTVGARIKTEKHACDGESSSWNHVHPKLPDYEDLASRLAALRGV